MPRIQQLATAALLATAISVSSEAAPSVPPSAEAEMSGTVVIKGRTYTVEGGDILIDNGPAEAAEAPPVKGVRSLGNSDIDAQNSNRWPNFEVVYKIDWTLTDNAIDNLNAAIAAIESETCIQFRECSGSNCVIPYALVSDDGSGSCYAEAGVNPLGQPNVLNIGFGCSVGNSIHELLHTLGVLHEHSRSDRDNFITINTANIQIGKESQFDIKGEEDVGPYDYGSIMHYGPTAFTTGGNTIDAPPPFDTIIGQRVALSAGDIATIDHIYGIVPGPFDTSFTVEIRCNDFWEHELHVLNYNPNNVNGEAYNQFNLYDYTNGTEVYLGYIRDGHFPSPLEVGHIYYVKHGVWNCKASWQESRIYSISLKPSDVDACTPSIQCSGELTVVEQQLCITSCGVDKKTGDHMIMSYFGLNVSPQKCHNGIIKVEYQNTDNWPIPVFTSYHFPWRNVYCTAGDYNMVATIYFKDGVTATRSLYSQECDDDVPLIKKGVNAEQSERTR